MNNKAIMSIIFDAQDKTQKAFRGIKKNLQGMESNFRSIRNAGAVAFAGIGLAIGKLVNDSMEVDRVSDTYKNLLKSVGYSDKATKSLQGLRKATNGLVNDTDLMKAGNKFMAMGLAKNQVEMEKLSGIATRLGQAMGEGPTESMENFALMLANQSILRLDSFGISSGKVRARIEELTTGVNAVDRETAFMTATMEQANMTMKKLGDYIPTPAENLAKLGVSFSNLKSDIGNEFIKVLDDLYQKFKPMIDSIMEWISQNKELVAKIGMVALGVAGLAVVVGTLGLAVNVLFSPITLIIGAIALLTAGVVWAYNEFETFRDTLNFAWEVIKVLGGWIKSIFIVVWNTLIGTFKILWKIVKTVAGAFFDLGKWLAEKFIGMISGAKDIIDNLTSGFSDLSDTIKGAVSNAFDSVAKKITWVIDKAKQAWNWIKKVLGFGDDVDGAKSKAKRKVKSHSSSGGGGSFAWGGIINAPVGQPVPIIAHGGEEIIPYHKRNNSSGSVSVNINGGMYLDERGADEIGNRILDRIKSNIIL